jgi:hypothetical protein
MQSTSLFPGIAPNRDLLFIGRLYSGIASSLNSEMWAPTDLLFTLTLICIKRKRGYPPIQCILHESRLGYSTCGACGIRENIGASISAITSPAVYNATGKWIYDFPVTPEKVLRALKKI